jgi:hypothetical protein
MQNHKNLASCYNLVLPSLTSGTSRFTAPSVLTNNIKIDAHLALAPVKVKVEPAPDTIKIYSDGGLSDNDETKGTEGEMAAQVTSSSQHIWPLLVNQWILGMFLPSRQ